MKKICQRYVLPLAGPPGGDFFTRREADEPHLRVLSEVLNITFKVQNVCSALRTTVTETGDNLGFDLLYDGSHYELLY